MNRHKHQQRKLPGNVVDDGSKVGWSVQLDRVESAIIRLQYAVNALAVRVRRMAILHNILHTAFVVSSLDHIKEKLG